MFNYASSYLLFPPLFSPFSVFLSILLTPSSSSGFRMFHNVLVIPLLVPVALPVPIFTFSSLPLCVYTFLYIVSMSSQYDLVIFTFSFWLHAS
jgi:hypothetical protein